MEVQEVLFQRAAPLSAALCAFEQHLGLGLGALGRQGQSLAQKTPQSLSSPSFPRSAGAAGAQSGVQGALKDGQASPGWGITENVGAWRCLTHARGGILKNSPS